MVQVLDLDVGGCRCSQEVWKYWRVLWTPIAQDKLWSVKSIIFWESAWDFEAISLRLSESMTFLDVAAALLSVQRVAPWGQDSKWRHPQKTSQKYKTCQSSASLLHRDQQSHHLPGRVWRHSNKPRVWRKQLITCSSAIYEQGILVQCFL